MKQQLVNDAFWDNYWEYCKLPSVVDYTCSFDRCIAKKLKKVIVNNFKGKTILEVGCAPGKWLIFFAKEFGMIPFGIDYSQQGINLTKKNFEILNVDTFGLKSVDFLKAKPDVLHDIVISLGFVEHFSRPNFVIQKHINWLKKDGLLIIGIPNFMGVYRPIQKILSDRILQAHNLNIMNLEYFYNIENVFNVKLIEACYLGSFQPNMLIDENFNPKFYQKLINLFINTFKKVRNIEFFDIINNKYISSYILAVYKKLNV
jgi:2-polyprenyl-3-methyl-5-hydroxy-6-metoxy-1,4-benzoquinol methylase